MKTFKVNLKSKKDDKEMAMFLSWDVPVSSLPTLIEYLDHFKRNKKRV